VTADLSALLDRLASREPGESRAAKQALIDVGKRAVDPVLRVLCDESSPIDWGDSAWILRKIGDPAFDPLVSALAAATSKEVARRCGWAFSGLDVADKARYLTVLSHPSARVRSNAVYVFQNMKEQAGPYVPQLAMLLADDDADVRQRVIWAMGEIGAVALPVLRQVRSGGTSGRGRRAALTALAGIGGWDALDERDQHAVTRLIAVKSVSEVPEPMHLCGSWFALPTNDQAAVLDAFELTNPQVVTMRAGGSAWNHDHHNWSSFKDHPDCRRLYVSPVLDGWTLVFGRTPHVAHAGRDAYPEAMREHTVNRCAELSSHFGAAHWYGISCGDGWTAWCIAEGSEVLRYYDNEDLDHQIGDTHPAEAGFLLPHEDGFPDGAFAGVPYDQFHERYQQLKQELNIPDQADAATVAARASVDPSALSPHTHVSGRPVIALTTCGATRPSTPGALAI
jgi:hypothetical protein